jgi:hypothetical protein
VLDGLRVPTTARNHLTTAQHSLATIAQLIVEHGEAKLDKYAWVVDVITHDGVC